MSNGNYTWESVMLGIDVKNEATAKQRRQRDIQQKQLDEAEASSKFGLGATVLGWLVGGPAWAYAFKKLTEVAVDYHYDWETDTVDVGKFNKQEAIDFNESIAKAAEDQTTGQWINALVDLGKMYVQSGGLTAEPGEWDPTTFGSGEGEWSVFGRGDPGAYTTTGTPFTAGENTIIGGIQAAPGSELTPVIPGMEASADYVPSLWDRGGGLFQNIGKVGMDLRKAYTQSQSLDLLDEWYKSKQEKAE